MAKRKTKKAASAAKRKAKAAATPRVKTAEAPRKPGKGIFLIAALCVFALLVAAEMYYVSKKSAVRSMRPQFVKSWAKSHKGVTSIAAYSNHLYMIDNTRGSVYKYDRQNGTLLKIYEYEEGVYGAAEASGGTLFILHKNNTITRISSGDKVLGKIPLGGIQIAGWIDIDSNDNLFISDKGTGKITKFSPEMEKTAEFGGSGTGKDKFIQLAKVFTAPDDTIYCVNRVERKSMDIKIFTNDGKFKKSWPVKQIQEFSGLENIAVSPSGEVYINSFDASKVFVFDNNGKFLSTFETDTAKRFVITYPASLCGDKKEDLLYVDTHQLGIFNYIKY